MAVKRRPAVAVGLLARPGGAPERGTPVEALPTNTATTGAIASAGGLKAATVGTTLYLLPEESRRLRHLAVDLGSSVHDLLLQGLDHILAEHGQPPLKRYQPANGKKGKKR